MLRSSHGDERVLCKCARACGNYPWSLRGSVWTLVYESPTRMYANAAETCRRCVRRRIHCERLTCMSWSPLDGDNHYAGRASCVTELTRFAGQTHEA